MKNISLCPICGNKGLLKIADRFKRYFIQCFQCDFKTLSYSSKEQAINEWDQMPERTYITVRKLKYVFKLGGG